MDLQALDQRRFSRARFGQHECPARPDAPHGQRHRERAAHRPQVPGQRQLAGELVARQLLRVDLPVGGEDAERHREIEAAGLLGQVGGREVDSDPLVVGKVQAAMKQCGAHPLACLLHLGVGQPHHGETWQPVGQMHLDGDFGRRKPVQATAVEDGQRHRDFLSCCVNGRRFCARPARRARPLWATPRGEAWPHASCTKEPPAT